MNKKTIINIIALWLIVISFTYTAVLKNKVNASEQLITLQKEKLQLIETNQLLEAQKQEESDSWWVDEYAKQECIQSWEESQAKRNKRNIQRENEITANSWRIEQIDEEMGLIMQRKLQ